MAVSKVDRIAGGASVSIPVSLTTSMGATTTEGILLGATNSATAGAQVFSPALHFQGSGWKTTATAAAQSCDWKVEVQPSQGTTKPLDQLVYSASEDGGAYTARWIFGGYNDGTGDYGLFPGALTKVGLIPYSTADLLIGNASNYYFRFGSQLFNASAVAVLGWANIGSSVNSPDTGLSRISAGVVGVGTGAAGDFAGTIKLTRLVTAPLTFATLPASPSTGARCMITDATSTTFAALATTGGAIVMPVFYDGTNWKIG